ncbi:MULTISPECIES: metallophosphoesterase [Anaeromyxobacter]|uniref:metallophosphoesterase n=1 Tax=Anaeromyxobacter TaxID=161492 RepID=UPI001F5927BF|nr:MULTISPECIES: metallophosphoesterase [unclassified Anaeromyxobacter]
MSRALSLSIFVVVSLAVLGGMHTYLWIRLVRDTAMADPWRRVATVSLVVLSFAMPLGLVALRAAPRPLARIVPAVAFGWLGLAFMLFCALVAIDAVRAALHGSELLADWLRRRPDPPADPARRLFVARAIAGGAALATGGAAALAFRAATGPAEISEVPVRLERLPPTLSGLTIAQLTDLHVGPTIGERDVRRAVDQTNALRPDVIAITGDLVDGSVRDLGRAISHLGRLRARYGVYFVTGNHEYYSGVEEWLEELPRLGVRVLRNERVTVGDAGASIDLAGVDDWSAARMNGGHENDLRRALAGRDPERGLVLLAHQPRGVAEAVQAGVELQLSGHTHGGQIVPFNLLVAAAQPYVKGLHRHAEGDRAGQIFVSRGTGYWGPPLRLGSPPEIARIVLTT